MKMTEQNPFSEVFNSNNHHLMNLMYTLAKVWLQSYIQFPHSSSYIQGDSRTTFNDDAFMNFSPHMKTYHLPDSGGSYLSRFINDTSHILLTAFKLKLRTTLEWLLGTAFPHRSWTRQEKFLILLDGVLQCPLHL